MRYVREAQLAARDVRPRRPATGTSRATGCAARRRDVAARRTSCTARCRTTSPTRSAAAAARDGRRRDARRRARRARARSGGSPTAWRWSATHGGVRCYDDSKATAPHAVLAAVRAFDSVVLIAGGRNKGLDLGGARRPTSTASGPSSPSARPRREVDGAFDGQRAGRRSPRRWTRPWPRPRTLAEARRRRAPVARLRVVRLVPQLRRAGRRLRPRRARADRAGATAVSADARPGDRGVGRRPPAAARTSSRSAEQRPSTYWLLLVVMSVLLDDRPGDGAVGVVGAVAAGVRLVVGLLPAPDDVGRRSAWSCSSVVVAHRLPALRRRWPCPLLAALARAARRSCSCPGIGIEVNGARSWIGVGPLPLPAAEFAKLALLLFCADLLARRSHRMDDARLTLVPILVGRRRSPASLMMLQPDLGGTHRRSARIVFAVLFVAGVPLLRLTGVLSIGGRGRRSALAMSRRYRRARLLAFLHPSAGPGQHRLPDQPVAHRARLGRAGSAPGSARAAPKYGFLPNAHTDFIFAIIGEELGLLGAMLVVALFVGFAVLGVQGRAAGARPLRHAASPPASPPGSWPRRSSTSAA